MLLKALPIVTIPASGSHRANFFTHASNATREQANTLVQVEKADELIAATPRRFQDTIAPDDIPSDGDGHYRTNP